MAPVNPIQVQKFLSGVDYPVSKEDLVAHVKQNGADEEVINTLQQLPNEEFQTPAEVSQGIGGEDNSNDDDDESDSLPDVVEDEDGDLVEEDSPGSKVVDQ